MNITEANTTALVIGHLTGQRPITDEELQDSLEFLAARAGIALQMHIAVPAVKR